MAFMDKVKELLDQGVSASRDFVSKAGAKAQDLGEKGVIKLELMQLENQAQKLIAKLGAEAYENFVEREQDSVSRSETKIAEILSEIEKVKNLMERREEDLRTRDK